MALAVTQTGVSNGGKALGFTAVAGRLILWAGGLRAWPVNMSTPVAGWTELVNVVDNVGSPPIAVFGKIAVGGETTFPGVWANNDGAINDAVSIEVAGATLAGFTLGAGGGYVERSFAAGSPQLGPSITPDSGKEVLLFSAADTIVGDCGVGAGWTHVGPANASDWPTMLAQYRIVNPSSGSYTPQYTNGSNNSITIASLAVYADVLRTGAQVLII